MVSDDLRALLEAERTRTHERIEALRRDYAAILDGMALTSTDDEHDPEGQTTAVDRSRTEALLAGAERPVLYVGGGVGMANAEQQLRDFAATTGMPAVTTLKGIGALDPDSPVYLGMLGMHGTKAANLAVQQCDLLVVVGADRKSVV